MEDLLPPFGEASDLVVAPARPCGQRRPGRPLVQFRWPDQGRVLNLGQRGHQARWHHGPADAIARHAVAFGEGAQADGVAAAAARRTGAPGPYGSVVEEGIGLIADVDQAAAGAELVDGLQDGPWNDGSAGVVGGDRDDRSRACADGLLEPIGVRDHTGVHRHRTPTGNADGHLMVEVIGDRKDDFIPWVTQGLHHRLEGHVAAGRDQDFAAAAVDLMLLLEPVLQLGPQRRVAGHRSIAVQVGIVEEGALNGFDHLRWRRPGRDALSERQGPGGRRDQLGHHGDDRCLDLLKAPGAGHPCV